MLNTAVLSTEIDGLYNYNYFGICSYLFLLILVLRTMWGLIQSVIIRVITKSRESDLLITSMITDRHQMTQSPLTN